MPAMRQIPLKVVIVDTLTLDYKEMILSALKNPKDGKGAGKEEIRRVLQVQQDIKAATGDSVLISEEAWQEVNPRVQATQWVQILPEFQQYMEDIENAPSVEVAPV